MIFLILSLIEINIKATTARIALQLTLHLSLSLCLVLHVLLEVARRWSDLVLHVLLEVARRWSDKVRVVQVVFVGVQVRNPHAAPDARQVGVKIGLQRTCRCHC